MKNLIILVLLSLYTYTTLSQNVQLAVAVFHDIRGGDNDNPITGTIYFINNGTGANTITNVRMNLSNIDDGEYGVHIHDFGDFRGFVPDASENISEWRALGMVFNPDNSERGCPELANGTQFAFGDLGNWQASSGLNGDRQMPRSLPLTGANSLIGRSVVIYDSAFDCNDIGNFSGNAIAVGIIGIANAPRNRAAADPNAVRAVCVLHGTSVCNNEERECDFGQAGVFIFEDSDNSDYVRIRGVVNGLNEKRGIHIHEFGDMTDRDNATSAGEHYNPDGYDHGLPGLDERRHLGALGNIQNFQDNNGYYDLEPSYTPATAFSVNHLIGRSLIIHTSFDHGNDPTCPEGRTTGNSGMRELICVIGIINSNDNNDGTFFFPNIPEGLTLNNNFTLTPCNGTENNNVTTTTTGAGITTTGGGGVVITDGEDFWDEWRVPEDASAEALVGSVVLLLIINFVVLFV